MLSWMSGDSVRVTPVSSLIVTPPSCRPKWHFGDKSSIQKLFLIMVVGWELGLISDVMTQSGHSSVVIDRDPLFLIIDALDAIY